MDDFSLAGEFPAASEAEWRAIVDKALAGAPFSSLRTALYEGFETEPLYAAGKDRLSPPLPLHTKRGWQIVQPLSGITLEEVRSQLQEDLAGGTDALWVDLDGLCGGDPLPIKTSPELAQILPSEVRAGSVPVYLAGGSTAASAALFMAHFENGAVSQLRGSAGFDPLTAVAVSGEIAADRSVLCSDFVDAAFYLREAAPLFTPFLASDRAWHGAGGSAVHELAFTLAAGVAYWRALAEAGMPAADGLRCVGFALTASADIFLTIAKLRAMRLLWDRAATVAEQKPNTDLLLLAQMSHRMLSAYDPHTNLLRGTAAAFGAPIGGASGILLYPFDTAAGGSSPFSRRLARNTSSILKHETQLGAVADAAAGSAYVEDLTRALAERAWGMFRETEAQGGLAAALESSFVQDGLNRASEQRKRAVARRKDRITGVSVFPNLEEKTPPEVQLPSVLSGRSYFEEMPLPAAAKGGRFAALVAAARGGAALSRLQAASRIVTTFCSPGLTIAGRDAEPFERLRRKSDRALSRLGSRPPVFLALLGKPEDYRARANWVQGFFAAGGIETIVPSQGFEDIAALVASFKESPAPVACLCSSNGVYGAMNGAAAALKKSGAVFVYVAGPGAVLRLLAPQDASAVDRLIHDGCNAVSTLQEAQDVLRVEYATAVADDESEDWNFGFREAAVGFQTGDSGK